MQVQFNSDSSVMGTENVAERIEASVRDKLARFSERLTRIEIHVRDENGAKHGADDKACTIEARPRGGRAIGVTEHAAKVGSQSRVAIQDQHLVIGPGQGQTQTDGRGPVHAVGKVCIQVPAGRNGVPLPQRRRG